MGSSTPRSHGWGRSRGNAPRPCPSRTGRSTGSSPPRCWSTSPDDEQAHGRAGPGAPAPAAPWRSPCRAAGPSSSTGPSPTSTTTCPAATSASTGRASSGAASSRPACGPPAATTPTASTPPYWWLRCLVGPTNDDHPAVSTYHRLLVWDIEKAPQGHPVRRPGAQPPGRQEPGGLPGEARGSGTGPRHHRGGPGGRIRP